MARKAVRLAKKEVEPATLYTGENLSVELVEDGMVHIIFDPSARLGRSASGKTTRVCSTEGNKSITLPDGESVTIGFNAYVK